MYPQYSRPNVYVTSDAPINEGALIRAVWGSDYEDTIAAYRLRYGNLAAERMLGLKHTIDYIGD